MSYSVVGPVAVNAYRELMLLHGLRFEIKCPGMRLTGKAPKCSTIIRREYGLKGKPAKLLEQFEALLAKQRAEREAEALAFMVRELAQNAEDNDAAHEDCED